MSEFYEDYIDENTIIKRIVNHPEEVYDIPKHLLSENIYLALLDIDFYLAIGLIDLNNCSEKVTLKIIKKHPDYIIFLQKYPSVIEYCLNNNIKFELESSDKQITSINLIDKTLVITFL